LAEVNSIHSIQSHDNGYSNQGIEVATPHLRKAASFTTATVSQQQQQQQQDTVKQFIMIIVYLS
jgi:hypothetical protein